MGECAGLQLGGGTIAVDSIRLGILGFRSHGRSALDLVLALGSGIHGICRHHHHHCCRILKRFPYKNVIFFIEVMYEG